MYFLWLYTIHDPLKTVLRPTFDPLVEKHCNRLCLTHRRVTIRATQRSIGILHKNKNCCIGLESADPQSFRYRIGKNGIVASLGGVYYIQDATRSIEVISERKTLRLTTKTPHNQPPRKLVTTIERKMYLCSCVIPERLYRPSSMYELPSKIRLK